MTTNKARFTLKVQSSRIIRRDGCLTVKSGAPGLFDTVWKRFSFACFLSLVPTIAIACNGKPDVNLSTRPAESNMNSIEISKMMIEGHVYKLAKTNEGHEVQRRPVADAVVYLLSADGLNVKTPEDPVVLHIKNGRVNPAFTCVVVGQELIAEIADDRQYNILIDSPVEPKFGQLVPNDSHRIKKVFTEPTNGVSVTCNIDPKLCGHIAVLANPVFARTGEKGEYHLPVGLPPGKYELRAYNPKYGLLKSNVECSSTGKMKVVDFDFPLAADDS